MILSIDEQRRRHWQSLSKAEKITAFEELAATDCWAFLSAGIKDKIRAMIEASPAPVRPERTALAGGAAQRPSPPGRPP